MRRGREQKNVPIKISSNKSPVWVSRKIKLIDGGICAKVLILETGTASCGETRSHFLNTKEVKNVFMDFYSQFWPKVDGTPDQTVEWCDSVGAIDTGTDVLGATLVEIIILKLAMAAQ